MSKSHENVSRQGNDHITEDLYLPMSKSITICQKRDSTRKSSDSLPLNTKILNKKTFETNYSIDINRFSESRVDSSSHEKDRVKMNANQPIYDTPNFKHSKDEDVEKNRKESIYDTLPFPRRVICEKAVVDGHKNTEDFSVHNTLYSILPSEGDNDNLKSNLPCDKINVVGNELYYMVPHPDKKESYAGNDLYYMVPDQNEEIVQQSYRGNDLYCMVPDQNEEIVQQSYRGNDLYSLVPETISSHPPEYDSLAQVININ